MLPHWSAPPICISTPSLAVQRREVVGLEGHVAELGEREASIEALLNGVLGQHVGHGEVLADVAQVLDQRQLAQPVEVVREHGLGGTRREVEEPLQLRADRGHVALDRRRVEQVPLGRAPRWIADHPGPATDERHRPSTEPLEADQPEDRHEVADVQRLPRGVESDVGGDRPARCQALRQARRGLVEDPPPLELREQPAEPGRVAAGGRIAHLDVTGWGPEPSLLRPVRLDRASIPCMVSSRQSCKPASGGSVVAGSVTAAAPAGTVRTRPRPSPSRSPSSCSWSSPCSAWPVPARPSPRTRTCRATSRIRSRRWTTSASPSRRPCTTASGDVQLARLGDDRREVVTFAEIPPALIDATTSIEDKTFWENSGFDPAGFVAAAIDTIQGRDRGGSTITQQLVRARLLPVERVRGQRLRAQGQGDHPVDPPDRGLPGRGRQADDHREVPQPELLRQPQLRRRRRGAELLAQGPQGSVARPDGDPGRHPPVPHPVRPRQERDRGDVQGQQGRRAGAPRGAADERDRPAPQLHPRPDEDPQRPDQGRLHRRGLRGRQDRARHHRLADRRPVARAPVRVAGALRARPDPVRRRRASARRSTPAATRS